MCLVNWSVSSVLPLGGAAAAGVVVGVVVERVAVVDGQLDGLFRGAAAPEREEYRYVKKVEG